MALAREGRCRVSRPTRRSKKSFERKGTEGVMTYWFQDFGFQRDLKRGSKRASTIRRGKTQAELLSSNVAGFIYVTEVDMANKRFTYLAPGSGELPSRNLLAGSLKWIET